ncbi:MAG: asparagine synthase (glutamine-hydrolyzing) [Desulfovibrio sp.]|nr:asparagine synthase (glutamine-hydrolyzing) [Desulfovibrio sp.]
MCAIAGIVARFRRSLPDSAPTDVATMTDTMAHRGPDGQGIWRGDTACFGHRRLAIIDLVDGTQPMLSHDKRFCITYNGEIYNFRSLRTECLRHGAHFRTNSDTEILLESYRLWGKDCLAFLEGMFAFAILDTQTRTLFLARDRFGKKPLFYTFQNGCCYFASELSALTALSSLSLHIDLNALVRFCAYEYVPNPNTMYREIQSLPPSHFATLTDTSFSIERYWDLPTPLAENKTASPEDLAIELKSLLRQAVRRRLISDVPLGVFLSGGIDSSLVTALMAEALPTVKTFSIGFQEASYDESRYAHIIRDTFATNHTECILSADQCADILPDLIQAMDVPMADASIAPTYLLSHMTRQSVTVALGGDGSDELWAGYENYAAYALGLFYQKLPRWLRRGIIEPVCAHLPSQSGYVNLHRAMQTFLHASYTPNWLRMQDLLTALHDEFLPTLFTKDVQTHLRLLHDPNELFSSTRVEYEHWQDPSISPLARAFHVYCRQYLPEDILVKVDRCSMLNSLEVRAPFLDTDLASFTARLPLSLKCQGLKGKKLLRMAIRDILPARILHRNKRGFQIPVADWLRGRLKPLLDDTFAPQTLHNEGIFDPKALSTLIELHTTKTLDLRKELWTLLVLLLWLRKQVHAPAFAGFTCHPPT